MQERNEPLPGLLYEADLPAPTHGRSSVTASRIPPQQQQQQQRASRTMNNHSPNVKIPAPGALGVGMSSLISLMSDTQDRRRLAPSSSTADQQMEQEEVQGLYYIYIYI